MFLFLACRWNFLAHKSQPKTSLLQWITFLVPVVLPDCNVLVWHHQTRSTHLTGKKRKNSKIYIQSENHRLCWHKFSFNFIIFVVNEDCKAWYGHEVQITLTFLVFFDWIKEKNELILGFPFSNLVWVARMMFFQKVTLQYECHNCDNDKDYDKPLCNVHGKSCYTSCT